MKKILAIILSLAFFPGCAANKVQQEIDAVQENAVAIQRATEFIRLTRIERNSKCRGAHETFLKLTSTPRDVRADLRPTVDYLTHVYKLQSYMNANKVTAETALTVMGDLVVPPALPNETDPFNGCLAFYGNPPDQPMAYRGGKVSDDFIFYWQLKDWREDTKVMIKIWDKFLPSEKRTPLSIFIFEYALSLSNTIMERVESREITLLQSLQAGNAGIAWLLEQAKQYGAQLKDNLARAKEQDNQTLMTSVAIGLGVVATAALLINADANYRIANAQMATAQAMQMQSQRPIRCNYTLPSRYNRSGYVNCQ